MREDQHLDTVDGEDDGGSIGVTQVHEKDELRSDAVVPKERTATSAREWIILVLRTVLRSLTYTAYDFACMLGFKDLSRVVKVLVESVVDEAVPPERRSLEAKCMEYLIPVAVSSFLTWLVRFKRRAASHSSAVSYKPRSQYSVMLSAAFVVGYRILRQAAIYRLFFRFGSAEYILVSVVCVVIAFFKEEGWSDLFRIRRWFGHICWQQGLSAVVRSFVYALAFMVPVNKLLGGGQPMRRCNNVRKFIYFIGIALVKQLWCRLQIVKLQNPHPWVSPLKSLPRVAA